MECRVTIKNMGKLVVAAGHARLVVNICETHNPHHEGKTVERHNLAIGQEVTVTVDGWRRYANVFEAAAAEERETRSRPNPIDDPDAYN